MLMILYKTNIIPNLVVVILISSHPWPPNLLLTLRTITTVQVHNTSFIHKHLFS